MGKLRLGRGYRTGALSPIFEGRGQAGRRGVLQSSPKGAQHQGWGGRRASPSRGPAIPLPRWARLPAAGAGTAWLGARGPWLGPRRMRARLRLSPGVGPGCPGNRGGAKKPLSPFGSLMVGLLPKFCETSSSCSSSLRSFTSNWAKVDFLSPGASAAN